MTIFSCHASFHLACGPRPLWVSKGDWRARACSRAPGAVGRWPGPPSKLVKRPLHPWAPVDQCKVVRPRRRGGQACAALSARKAHPSPIGGKTGRGAFSMMDEVRAGRGARWEASTPEGGVRAGGDEAASGGGGVVLYVCSGPPATQAARTSRAHAERLTVHGWCARVACPHPPKKCARVACQMCFWTRHGREGSRALLTTDPRGTSRGARPIARKQALLAQTPTRNPLPQSDAGVGACIGPPFAFSMGPAPQRQIV